MKICLVNRFFDIEKNAGLGRVAIELADRLEQRGHEVIRLGCPHAETLPGFFYDTHWWLSRHLPKGCDVYHALAPVESICLPKHRAVVTIEDLIPVRHAKLAGAGMQKNVMYQLIATGIYAMACHNALKKARRVVTPSNHTANELADEFRYNRDSIDVIKLGIRPDLKCQPIEHDWHRVGYLGQLDHRKRVHLLIQAFRDCPDLDAELVIGGSGPERPKLEALAAGDPRINFMGFIPDDGLNAFYNSLDLFVFPSAVEGYGLPPVEAMACGVPVIVMKDAVIPADVKNVCIQTDDLARSLTMYKGWRSKGETALQKWAQSHDWEKTVDAYESLYREVCFK